MSLIIGEINKLIVDRKTDIGYMLKSADEEVLLHFNETYEKVLEDNMEVEAFLYIDFKGRVAATLAKPLLTINKNAFLEAVDVNNNLGVFFDMGISKDVLLSKDDLPLDKALWPKKGDFCYLSLMVKKRFTTKFVFRENIPKEINKLLEKDKVNAYVHKISSNGLNLLTKDFNQIFVHQSMVKNKIRLGEEVEVKITYISDKGYSGSLIEQKEVSRFDDANIILSYLVRKGDLPLTSNSSPEDIEKYFQMSKRAFKRAIGLLYKERRIDFINNKTVLVDKELE